MKMIKVFFSLPMHGLTTAAIEEERIKMQNEFMEFLDELGLTNYTIQDVNAWYNKEADVNYYEPGRLYYLGRSIQAMDRADYVCFHRDWHKAKGCRAELEACRNYFEKEICIKEDYSCCRDLPDFEKSLSIIFWSNKSGSKELTDDT